MNQHDFLIALLVFLVAAVVAVPLARRLGLGAVLGYLIAGRRHRPVRAAAGHQCRVDPAFLGIRRRDDDVRHRPGAGAAQAQEPQEIDFRLQDRRSLRPCALVLGILAALLGAPWQVALVAGLGLALSSTAIAFATLAERNLMGTPGRRGQLRHSAIPGYRRDPDDRLAAAAGRRRRRRRAPHGPPAWQTAGKAVAVMALLVVVGRFLVRPAVLRFIARTGHARDVHRVRAAAGGWHRADDGRWWAFPWRSAPSWPGVLLADSEYRHALEADIEPFKGLLLGLFFMAVGMSIDFGVLGESPLQVVGLVAGLRGGQDADPRAARARASASRRGQWLLFAAADLARRRVRLRGVRRGRGRGPPAAAYGGAAGAGGGAVDGGHAVAAAGFDRPVARAAALPRLQGAARPTHRAAHPGADCRGFGRSRPDHRPPAVLAGHCATVLDHDPDQIEFLREFGFKVFYGDATRVDLLEAARRRHGPDPGGGHRGHGGQPRADRPRARALSAPGDLRAGRATSRTFTSSRTAAWRSSSAKMFEGSLMMGRRVLEGLGIDPADARQRGLALRRHNIQAIDRFYPHYTRPDQAGVAGAAGARRTCRKCSARTASSGRSRKTSEWS